MCVKLLKKGFYMKDKKLLTLFLVNAFFLIATIVTDILYMIKGNAYVFKTIASATFVLCAMVNLILVFVFKYASNKKFVIFLFVGQVFAMLGDILLIDHFIIGAVLFAIGHIFYFVSYCCLKPFKWLDLAFIFGAIGVSLCIIFASKIDLNDQMPLILGYAIIISCMLGKSATLFLDNAKIASIIFAGSLMFYLSDMFLMFTIFSSMGRVGSILCLAFYYPAEYILATSISAVSLIKKGEKNDQ